MIYTIKNNQGFVTSYIEWEIFDDKYVIDVEGKYLYIQSIWVHQDDNINNILDQFINFVLIHPKAKNIEFVFYYREKYKRVSKMYLASKFLKRINVKGAV